MNGRSNQTWWRDVDGNAWRALGASGTGWMLDAMDVMLYVMAIDAIGAEFNLSKAESGLVASATLFASAFGGVVSGMLADRFGRVRMLMISMLIYSLFTGLTATAQSFGQLIFWRALVGLGMGGEWSAGAVLVAESWPAQHRGKAIGLMQSGWAIGYIFAALLAATILPTFGWRAMFLVGVAPALLTIWIRRHVPEPKAWQQARDMHNESNAGWRQLLKPPLRSRMIIATITTATLLFAYWGLFTWVPNYLASSDEGGAGLGVVKSAGWIIPMQIGAFFGYVSFGFFSDRFGRKPTFIAFVLGAAAIVPLYGFSARDQVTLMLLGPFVGFLGHGYFSLFGALLAELFPAAVRGTAQGFCYNIGRAASALAPWIVGGVAEAQGFGYALSLTALFFVFGAVLILLLPETRGKAID